MEAKPAGRQIAQLTDLFPLPEKHTLEREEQEQGRWINLPNVKLPGEVLGQHVVLRLRRLASFIIRAHIPL